LPSDEKGNAYMERLDDLEKAAQEKHIGAWPTSTTQSQPPAPAATPSP
jgi:hypothetical protein